MSKTNLTFTLTGTNELENGEVSKYAYEIVFYPERLVSGWFDVRLETD